MAIIALLSLSLVHGKGNYHYLINIVVLVLVFFSTKLASTISDKWDTVVFPVVISLFCFTEVLIGYKKLLFHNEFVLLPSCVGSFDNPGPYGGFLAVCICILTYYLNYSNRLLRFFIRTTVITALIALVTTDSRAAYLTLFLGIGFYVWTNGNKKDLLCKYWLPITVSFIIVSIIAYLWKKTSADARLFIYGMSFRTLLEAGPLGVGFGHFGGAYADVQEAFFESRLAGVGDAILDISLKNKIQYIDGPIFAFNDFLQIGIEGGWLFLMAYVLVILISIRFSYNRNKGCCVGVICLVVFSLFSYPLENVEFRLILVFLVACSEPFKRAPFLSITSNYFYLVAFFLICLFCIKKAPELKKYCRAQLLKNNAEYAYLTEDYYRFLNIADKNIEYLSHDYSFLYQYGVSLNKTLYYEDSDSVLLLGSKMSSNPMFWNVLGNNSIAQGKYREAEERYKHAFYMVPNRLYPVYYLAKLYHLEGDTLSFFEMADRVEAFVPKIESTKTDSLREEIRKLKVDYMSKYERQ